MRSFGSVCISLTYVARGTLDGYQINELYAWDIAAGILLIREAGGYVSKPNGQPIDLNDPKLICAATDKLLKQMIEANKEALNWIWVLPQVASFTFIGVSTLTHWVSYNFSILFGIECNLRLTVGGIPCPWYPIGGPCCCIGMPGCGPVVCNWKDKIKNYNKIQSTIPLFDVSNSRCNLSKMFELLTVRSHWRMMLRMATGRCHMRWSIHMWRHLWRSVHVWRARLTLTGQHMRSWWSARWTTLTLWLLCHATRLLLARISRLLLRLLWSLRRWTARLLLLWWRQRSRWTARRRIRTVWWLAGRRALRRRAHHWAGRLRWRHRRILLWWWRCHHWTTITLSTSSTYDLCLSPITGHIQIDSGPKSKWWRWHGCP